MIKCRRIGDTLFDIVFIFFLLRHLHDIIHRSILTPILEHFDDFFILLSIDERENETLG